MTTFNAQAGFQPDADSLARRLNALEAGTGFTPVGPVLFANGSPAAPSIAFAGAQTNGIFNVDAATISFVTAGVERVRVFGSGLSVGQQISFGLLPSGTDTFLVRDAVNTLAQRNGTAAQTFNLYGTYTDASNWERVFFSFIGGAYFLRSDSQGTGLARDFAIGTSGAATLFFQTGGVSRFLVAANGTLAPAIDNTYDFGASANRVRTVFAAQINAATKAGAFVAADFAAGTFMVGRDTVGLTTKLYYNNGGTLQSVALA